MKIERMNIYNIYGLTSEQKSVIYNALHSYQKGFGQADRTHKVAGDLLDKFHPTDDIPMMDASRQDETVEAAIPTPKELK